MRRSAVKHALTLAAVVACGCAVAPPLPPPTQPSPVKASGLQTSYLWCEWYSDHLTLDSDVDAATATALLSDFERSVGAFDALFLSDVARPRTRLRVVLFAQLRDYWALGPRYTPGLYAAEEPDYESNATIFMPTRDSYRATVVAFQHELTHRHVNASMPQAPGWLDEGLAELWQSLHLGDHDTRLGYLPPALGDRDVDKLMRPDDRSFHWLDLRQGNYELAGAFVEFLWLEQHDAFLRYLHALAGGAAAATAWQQSFPQPVATAFETWYRAVKRGAGTGDVTVGALRIPRAPAAPAVVGAPAGNGGAAAPARRAGAPAQLRQLPHACRHLGYRVRAARSLRRGRLVLGRRLRE